MLHLPWDTEDVISGFSVNVDDDSSRTVSDNIYSISVVEQCRWHLKELGGFCRDGFWRDVYAIP